MRFSPSSSMFLLWFALFIGLLISLCKADVNQCVSLPVPGGIPVNICFQIVYGNGCTVELKVTAANLPLLDEQVDLSLPGPCPVIGGCASCVEFTPNVGNGACVDVVRTCPGKEPTRYELQCIPNFPLNHCLPCNCHDHGTCDPRTHLCNCSTGWFGHSCIDKAPLLSKCEMVSMGKQWDICGKVYLEDCQFNSVISQKIPLLQLEGTGKGSQCVGFATCNICFGVSDVVFSSEKNTMSGDTSVQFQCLGTSLDKSWGSFSATADFSDLQTRCFPCQGNCTSRGKCNFDGTCTCNGNFYGTACEFIPCPVGADNKLECGGDSRGSCNALTGKCTCASGFQGPTCTKDSQLYWIIGIALGGLVLVIVVVVLIYKCWWKPRKEAEALATTQVVNWVDEAEAEEAKLRALDADF